MNLPITFLLSVIIAPVLGQGPEKVYLNTVLEETSPRKASYYLQREGVEGSYFIARIYSMDGRLKAEGRYLDESCQIEHGMFTFYHANGKVESSGRYENGNKSGVWNRFDQWGRELAEKVYDPEPLAGIVYTRAEIMPQYPGGERELVKYIKDQVEDPNGKRLRGQVTTSFIVEKDGYLSNVAVVKGKNEEVDERVVNALKQSPQWEPGIEKGQPVRVKMRVPVQF
ncbi:MAG: energy transducer TonB [Flavobacteriales bacterium]|nr:energy transducer TonB [Flavobacteriales bacterium]